MQIVVDSLLINYFKVGNGKRCVLLLHGWGDNLKTFRRLQESLSKTYTVISIDLPGLGSSQAPPKVWGLDEYAEFLRDFLKKEGLADIYSIVGHSNGGAIAIRALSRKILDAEKLVLLSSAGIRDKLKARKLALKVIAKAGKVATLPLPHKTRNRIRRKFYGNIGSDLLVVEHMEGTFKKVVAQDVQADASEIKVPTLLIYGSKDTDTPPAYGMLFASLLGQSTYHEIEGAGHFVHHDKPEVVAELTQEFLDD